MNDLTLLVNGTRFTGWQSVSITRSMETIASGFNLSVSEKWQGPREPRPIRRHDIAQVLIGDVPVLSGIVDEVKSSFAKGRHSLSVSGRSKTGDLVDCSAVHSPGEWKKIKVDRLASILAEPFAVSVMAEVDVGKDIDLFKIQPAETAFEALERAARMRSLLPMPDADGNIVLTQTGTEKAETALIQGENITAGDSTFKGIDRFSEYTVLGQHFGDDETNGENAAEVAGEASDADVPRYRPLLVIGESNMTPAQAKKRAQWEAAVRAARSERANVTVQGWHQGNGKLWPVNALVQVESEWLGISGEMLITKAVFSLDEAGGTITSLELSRPDAFTPKPTVKAPESLTGAP